MHAHENPFRSDRVESLIFRENGVDVDDLYERHGGNIRECLRELYDVVGAG